MLTPYDSHSISSFTPPILEGKDLYISLLQKLIHIITLLMAPLCAVASPLSPADSQEAEVVADSTKVYFRQSSSGLDLNYDGNGQRLENILRQIENLTGQDSTFVISTLRVIGSSSAEGSEEINRRLSEQRARALFDYFAAHATLPDSITDFEYLSRNWRGLYNLVASDPAVPSQTEVLALLRKTVTGPDLSIIEGNSLLRRLKALKNGVPYSYIYKKIFPALRYAGLYVEFKKRFHQEIEQMVLKTIEAEESIQEDYLSEQESISQEYAELPSGGREFADESAEMLVAAGQLPETEMKAKREKPFYMDLRTNMLYDIAAVPNIGAEFYLGKNFSIQANWMYGWWDNNRRHRYWRIYGGELGSRWWFGRKASSKPLTGHHLGLYGGVLTFDFEWGDTGYMGGKPGGTLWDRCLVNSGIEYGYSCPIGRRLNIDFSIGIGYLAGKYIKYFPFNNEYFREKEYAMRFFGPAKAEISLVWLLGRANTNKRKGGDR